MRRFYAPTLTAQKIIHSGVLGQLKSISASQGTKMIRTGRDSSWYLANRAASGGGVLMETGSHLIDQVFSIAGAKNFSLISVAQVFSGDLDTETKALSEVTIFDNNNVKFNLYLSSVRDVWHGITFAFDNALLKVGVLPSTPTVLCSLDGHLVSQFEVVDGASLAPQAFYLEWSEFMRQCESGGEFESPISAQKTILTTDFIEKCYLLSEKNSCSV